MTYAARSAAIRAKHKKARAAREFKRSGGVFGAICRFFFQP